MHEGQDGNPDPQNPAYLRYIQGITPLASPVLHDQNTRYVLADTILGMKSLHLAVFLCYFYFILISMCNKLGVAKTAGT